MTDPETTEHLLCRCSVTRELWNRLRIATRAHTTFTTLEELWDSMIANAQQGSKDPKERENLIRETPVQPSHSIPKLQRYSHPTRSLLKDLK
ncbi:hypothetical protein QJS10_CPB22g00104 [Acorus calamus]|uniref:Uncharacterized protein n=1 Tax=Acorus calamus TaxID=4465 RepID=A0AAV9C195_ACOCL|nr:hypothetical protein QJS10_CPB22g00104 [Acorus calamus]